MIDRLIMGEGSAINGGKATSGLTQKGDRAFNLSSTRNMSNGISLDWKIVTIIAIAVVIVAFLFKK